MVVAILDWFGALTLGTIGLIIFLGLAAIAGLYFLVGFITRIVALISTNISYYISCIQYKKSEKEYEKAKIRAEEEFDRLSSLRENTKKINEINQKINKSITSNNSKREYLEEK